MPPPPLRRRLVVLLAVLGLLAPGGAAVASPETVAGAVSAPGGAGGKGAVSTTTWDDARVRALRPVAVRPLDGPLRVGRRFEPPPQPWLAGHRGVDLVGGPGAAVRSVLPGTVVFAGSVAGRPVVSVDHRGLRVTYEPVLAAVAAGDAVVAGQPLGSLAPGHAGCPSLACLHLGLRVGRSTYLDPLLLLGGREVRLLPLT